MRRKRPELIRENVSLARLTTSRTGGRAAYFARIDSEVQLAETLGWAATELEVVRVIGSGSNLLVADEGVSGLVVKLSGDFSRVRNRGTHVICGAAARLPSVAARSASWGLTGLEFGVNIPGSVGGSIRMNANAFGGALDRVLQSVALRDAATRREYPPDDLGFGYRSSRLPNDAIVVEATFELASCSVQEAKSKLESVRSRRRESQPTGIRTFGSTFRNPDESAGGGSQTAAMLLDRAGCRDLPQDLVRFSDKHINFIEVDDEATSTSILRLMSAARTRVFEQTGILLEPEVELLGAFEFPADWVHSAASGAPSIPRDS